MGDGELTRMAWELEQIWRGTRATFEEAEQAVWHFRRLADGIASSLPQQAGNRSVIVLPVARQLSRSVALEVVRTRVRIGPFSDLSVLFRVLTAVAGLSDFSWGSEQTFSGGWYIGAFAGDPEHLLAAVRSVLPDAWARVENGDLTILLAGRGEEQGG